MSPQTAHFWVFDKSPLSGPQRGPPSCNTWIPSPWQPSKQMTQMMLCDLRLSGTVLSAFSATSPQKVFSASQAVFLGAHSYTYPTAEGTAPQKDSKDLRTDRVGLTLRWIPEPQLFHLYNWNWAGPCGAPGYRSLSVSPVSWLQKIGFIQPPWPSSNSRGQVQLPIREGKRCRDEGGTAK